MYFRPYFWLTFVSVPALIILLLLGSWQVQRLNWKTELIAEYQQRATADPIALPADDIIADQMQFTHVKLTGRFLHDNELFLTGRTYEGNAGFHVVTPFVTNDNRVVLVNRGWVSEAYRPQDKRLFSVKDEQTSVSTIVRAPQRKGYFVPENDPEGGFWFTLKPDEMAAHLGRDDIITTFYLDSVRTSEVITLPIAAELKINVSNAHLNYALTWFGIALSLIGVYIAYHVNAGRLRFGANTGKES